MAAIARVTASRSALTKFTVTGVPPDRPPLRRAAPGLGGSCASTGAVGSISRASSSGSSLGWNLAARGDRGVMEVIRSK